MFPTVEPLGAGLEHNAYLVNGDLVVRFRRASAAVAGSSQAGASPVAEAVGAEARLLAFVAGISPLPVPRPIFVDPQAGCLAWPRLPGVPLIAVDPRPFAAVAPRPFAAVDPRTLIAVDPRPLAAVEPLPLGAVDARPSMAVDPRVDVAAQLGGLLSVLHAVPIERVAGFAEVDDAPPGEWFAEARELWPAVAGRVPAAYRPAVEAFLAAPPPGPAPTLVFSHQDLGIEHVLVDAGTGAVTGVIDWSDAAVGDPARDYGLILRDLGPSALAAASPPGDRASLRRIWFYARCGLVADLAYGLETGRHEYVTKSLTALSWLFPP